MGISLNFYQKATAQLLHEVKKITFAFREFKFKFKKAISIFFCDFCIKKKLNICKDLKFVANRDFLRRSNSIIVAYYCF
jgi:hypothetical protein